MRFAQEHLGVAQGRELAFHNARAPGLHALPATATTSKTTTNQKTPKKMGAARWAREGHATRRRGPIFFWCRDT